MRRLQKWRVAGIIFIALVMVFAILSITPIFNPIVTESSASGFYGRENGQGLVTIVEWLGMLLG